MAMADYTQCLRTLLMSAVATMLLVTVYVTNTDRSIATVKNRTHQFSTRGETEDHREYPTRHNIGEHPWNRTGLDLKNFREVMMNFSSSNNSPTPDIAFADDTTRSGDEASSCSPRKNIVFLKTHKTGSSTIQNIIYRFGDNHGLNFALPRMGSNYFGAGNKFSSRHVLPLPRGHQYNILANHAVWNRKAFHSLMPPDTVYLTILRHPTTQFESLYNYYHWMKYFRVPFREFVEDPETHYRHLNKTTSSPPKHGFKNPSLYDLGMESPDVKAGSDHNEEEIFHGMIHSLRGDFHLVLILEYVEESIILLKDLLCWSWDDVVFFRVNARTKAGEDRLSVKSQKKLVDFNKGDWMLYNYFNDTLWRKVSEYGAARMEKDKSILRQKIDAWRQFCIAGTKMGQFKNTRIERFELSAAAKNNSICKQLVRSAMNYLYLLNKKMGQLWPIYRGVLL